MWQKIVVEPNHRKNAQQILEYLLNSPAFKPCLEGIIPLQHLLQRVGHVVQTSHQGIDLFKFYLKKRFVLDIQCPWTGSNSLDVALENNLLLESDMMLQNECYALLQLEAQQRFLLMGMPPSIIPLHFKNSEFSLNMKTSSSYYAKNISGIFIARDLKNVILDKFMYWAVRKSIKLPF